jgi:glycosyltransferase involved in cell wall biosynthesis
MPDKHLHIVTHDVPYPADFGGVIDLFYKIKTLHHLGIKIHLHCFTKNRPQQEELNKYCVSVNYYRREKNFSGISLRLPYIVNSRRSAALLRNLQNDTYPILLEGIHCTYLLQAGKLNDRQVLLRLHNIEFEYYYNLAKNEEGIIRRLFLLSESKLLKKYEKRIANKAMIIAVSKEDARLYQELFAAQQTSFLPVFVPYNSISSKKGMGAYCLYQGNLSINENEEAVTWLLENVFNDLSIPFIIAGNNPSNKLLHKVKQYKNVSIAANPSDLQLQKLIADAQVNVLPSFNKTGVKLKLLNALFNGRHCLVNNAGVIGSGVEQFCTIAETAAEFKACINYLFEHDFAHLELQQRQNILKYYNNELNAQQLISWLH